MSTEESPKTLSSLGGFAAGALAACGAVTVTNPIEIVKTRMQLQGELAAKGTAKKVYTGTVQGIYTIIKNEGWLAAQRGLSPAYIYQIGLNGCRLGLYEPTRAILYKIAGYGANDQPLILNMMAGSLSGIMGAVAGSPFYLIKIRMQSYSPKFHVGEQTHYKGIWDGLSTIWKSEGFRGLYRGVDSAILRTGAGSSVQLPIYGIAKRFIVKHDLIRSENTINLTASAISGLGVCIVMNPWDVLMTRMYNQKGDLYRNPIDCLVKTVKIEGIFALYKGFVPHLWRIGPHTILCLTLNEHTTKFVKRLEGVPL